MRTRRKSGTYAVGSARRQAILDVATARFAESGYHRTSMAQIAKDVGLTQPGLQYHFPSKKHLLVAVAEQRIEISTRRARQAEASLPSDGTEQFRALLGLTEWFVAEPGLIELFVIVSAEASDTSSPAYGRYVEYYEQVIAAMAEGFSRGVESGFLRPDRDYTVVAQQCIAMLDGLQLQWVLSGGTLDLVGQMRSYLEQVAPTLLTSAASVDLASAPVLP